ncbi:MAG TPA: hypothetical protein VFA13_00075 [Candidatus Acidoferrum sp.]|nr:hypothetical protein [Candidatus Acidoferrum sp.]
MRLIGLRVKNSPGLTEKKDDPMPDLVSHPPRSSRPALRSIDVPLPLCCELRERSSELCCLFVPASAMTFGPPICSYM